MVFKYFNLLFLICILFSQDCFAYPLGKKREVQTFYTTYYRTIVRSTKIVTIRPDQNTLPTGLIQNDMKANVISSSTLEGSASVTQFLTASHTSSQDPFDSDTTPISTSSLKNTISSSESQSKLQSQSQSQSALVTSSISEISVATSEHPTSSENFAAYASESPTKDFSAKYANTLEKVWKRFWVNNKWNENDSTCGGDFSETSVWCQAVIGRATVFGGDSEKIDGIIENIYKYKNKDLKVYSASTAGDEDIYNDDNGQLAWVFIDAYTATKKDEYLEAAKDIVYFLLGQWNDNGGGVLWKYKGDYIASISTGEAALAAVRLHAITHDSKLIDFAEKCMDFMFEHFQDPEDKLFYDGLELSNYSNINKGKLSYSVGTTLSTLAYLEKHTSKSWMPKAIEIGKAAMNKTGAFYTLIGIWNNQMKYVHLLYAGYVDLLTIADYQPEFQSFKNELLVQASYVAQFLEDPDDTNLYFSLVTLSTKDVFNRYMRVFDSGKFEVDESLYCNKDTTKATKKSLMVNASIAQILHLAGSV